MFAQTLIFGVLFSFIEMKDNLHWAKSFSVFFFDFQKQKDSQSLSL